MYLIETWTRGGCFEAINAEEDFHVILIMKLISQLYSLLYVDKKIINYIRRVERLDVQYVLLSSSSMLFKIPSTLHVFNSLDLSAMQRELVKHGYAAGIVFLYMIRV